MNNTKKTKGVMLLLVIAVILMTVGFAAYANTLNINGTVKVKGASWNIHYVNNDITETSGSAHATTATVDNTDFTFDVTLNAPGDYYEATINVINEGTLTAYLRSITMSTLTAEQAKYLTYKVYYNGTEYTASTSGLAIALAGNNATHPVKVRIDYILPANASDLPTDPETTVHVTGTLNYSSSATE